MQLPAVNWTVAASVATIVGVVFTVAAIVWRELLKRVLKPVLGALAHLDPLRSLKRDVAEIMRELKPNGGSSINDKVNAIWTRQGMTAATAAMLLDESEALLWQSDMDGHLAWASRSLVELTGRPATELIGWGWVNVIHPDERERIRKSWIACLAEGRNFEERCRFQTLRGIRQGPEYSGQLVAKPFVFDGKVIGWNGRLTLDPPDARREPARRSTPSRR